MRCGWRLSWWWGGRLIAAGWGVVFGSIQFAGAQASRPSPERGLIEARERAQRSPTTIPASQAALLAAIRAQAAGAPAGVVRAQNGRTQVQAQQAQIAAQQAQIAAQVNALQIRAAVQARAIGIDPEREPEAFVVRKGDPGISDALAQIDEAAKDQKWEKVFGAVGKVMEAPGDSLARRADGFYVSVRSHVQRMLVQLPPAGRDAYRLFNDSTARKELEQADSPALKESATARIARLQAMFDRYFVTSVGDQIADRLGDAKFESGDFSGAANAWGAISTDYPDTSIPAARTLVKRAIALSRAARWDELSAVVGQLKEKYSDQSVRLGGREIAVSELLNGSAGSPIAVTPVVAGPAKSDPAALGNLLPRAGTRPSWQMVFRDETVDPQLSRAESMPMGGGGYDPSFIVPASVATSDRVYLNWMGIGIAIDAETGKLIWRSEPFNRIVPRVQQMVMTGSDTGESGIALSEGRDKLIMTNGTAGPRMVPIQALGGVARPPVQIQGRIVQQQPQFVRVGVRGSGVMNCISTRDGRPVWTSENEQQPDLCSLNIMGQPLVAGDTVLAVATPVYMGSELSLLGVSLSNGSLKWKLPLGSLGSAVNYRGTAAMSKPVLLQSGDRVYVLTGCGALVAVDLPGRRVDWVFTYEASPMQAARISGIYRKPEAQEFSSSMRLEGGVLYFKEKGSNSAYAVDTSGPKLLWQRRVDRDSTIAAVDATSVYILGEELSAIDLASKEMRWSAKTPLGPRQFQPLAEGARAYVFGSNGVYAVDLRSGATESFVDAADKGGAVFRHGDQMICVSNRSVTAYAIPKAEGGRQ